MPLRRPIKPEEDSSAGAAGGGGGSGATGVDLGGGGVILPGGGVVVLGTTPDEFGLRVGAGGVLGAGLLGIGGGAACAGAGAGGGGGGGAGLANTVPGGAASTTGAPHCSQKSPLRSKGPLQKRQTMAPGWVTVRSNDFFRASSSISTFSS